jgi:hypothetical protein
VVDGLERARCRLNPRAVLAGLNSILPVLVLPCR